MYQAWAPYSQGFTTGPHSGLVQTGDLASHHSKLRQHMAMGWQPTTSLGRRTHCYPGRQPRPSLCSHILQDGERALILAGWQQKATTAVYTEQFPGTVPRNIPKYWVSGWWEMILISILHLSVFSKFLIIKARISLETRKKAKDECY